MKRIFLIIIVFMCFIINPCLLYGQEDSYAELVEEFLKIINVEDNLQSNVNEMIEIQIRQNPDMLPYKDIMIEFYSKYLGWNSLKDELVGIYINEFSEKEMKELIDFYSSETGQKVLEKMPELFKKGAEIGQRAVMEHISELQEMIKQEAERLQQMTQ